MTWGLASAVFENMRAQETEARKSFPNQWVAIDFYEGILLAASTEKGCWDAVYDLADVDPSDVRVVHTRTWLDWLREKLR
jgi:hypothetical protein